jgi:hypothetical protein
LRSKLSPSAKAEKEKVKEKKTTAKKAKSDN